MGLILTAERRQDRDGTRADGVSLAQLAEIVERALKECQDHGVDASQVMPKTLNRFGGKITKISIEV